MTNVPQLLACFANCIDVNDMHQNTYSTKQQNLASVSIKNAVCKKLAARRDDDYILLPSRCRVATSPRIILFNESTCIGCEQRDR